MDAERFLVLIRRRWWLLMLGMVVAAGAYAATSQPAGGTAEGYRATTELLVTHEEDARQVVSAGSFAEVIKSQPVIEQALADLGWSESVTTVRSRIQTEVPRGTQSIRLTARGDSREQAAELADGLAAAFRQLHDDEGLPGAVSVYQPAQAVRAATPSGAEPFGVLLVALFGLTVAGGAVLLLDYLSDSVKTAKDVEAVTGLPVLATVPRWSSPNGTRAPLAAGGRGAKDAAERYRMLRTSVALRSTEEPAVSILFAAGQPGAGTTTTAANYAVALARTGRRVTLVDSNLRSPALHRIFGLPNENGLAQALARDSADTRAFLQSTEIDGLSLMTAGPEPSNPSELLASTRLDSVLAALKELSDAVVLDSPPALSMTDATVLASMADATIIVVRADNTSCKQAEAVVEALRCATARLLGVVLNGPFSTVRFGLPRLRLGATKPAVGDRAEADLRPMERTAG